MAESALRGTIEFFDRLGVYDVILPFLLVFTLVFAILERTKIFGTDKISGQEYPKKSLNAMAAFVIALLVVASSQIVGVINRSLAQIVLLLVLAVSFLMLIGTFFGKDEDVKLDKGIWRTGAMIFMGIGILSIFANELGWLEPTWNYVTNNWDSSVVGSIILIVFIVIFMGYITGESPKPSAEKKT
ncbi:MAG TPA: hypothetical protein VKE88_02480 [Candidatus Nanoarchaeia archaeon]|nr:hypothetical protein [Candidatus Nanoarchaeia archaeon]